MVDIEYTTTKHQHNIKLSDNHTKHITLLQCNEDQNKIYKIFFKLKLVVMTSKNILGYTYLNTDRKVLQKK